MRLAHSSAAGHSSRSTCAVARPISILSVLEGASAAALSKAASAASVSPSPSSKKARFSRPALLSGCATT